MAWDSEFGFEVTKFELKDDYEGRVEATLLSRKSKKTSSNAILYIHGFIDYFFQLELADWANRQGYNFYALDLRKYGRSMLAHQKANFFRNYNEYYEEIDAAVNVIRNKDKNIFLALIGHSTGGLISALYANDKADKKVVDALILNSPFFEFNTSTAVKIFVSPLLALVGKVVPNLISPVTLAEGYAKSIHKDYYGAWDFDTKLKPIKGFPIYFGWLNGIYTAQRRLQKGLKIYCPVLVLHASESAKPGKYNDDMILADAVLNVAHMKKYAPKLGEKVKIVEIKNGRHDLVLSEEEPRKKTYNQMRYFLEKIIPKTKST
ncbi:MAG: alpha/beta hydrolase [Bacteroidales bacterium]|jgi:alpha-beta hydrolase superfamily lysophospholipase|nr:alpha/beta hydrolase [Bacteroidales bacterium]